MDEGLRRRATLYIVDNDRILLISRKRNGRFFYVIPGGGVEPNESWDEAAVREAREETSLIVELGPILKEGFWQMFDTAQQERAYLVTNFEGVPQLNDAEMLARQTDYNQYALAWLPLDKFAEVECYPPKVNTAVILQALDKSDNSTKI
ncbi:MAG: NUDIX domain-containing protein [Candidatus Promineifilaceae bacterium]